LLLFRQEGANFSSAKYPVRRTKSLEKESTFYADIQLLPDHVREN